MNDYERGFIDGMSRQAQSSVDRAVNAMTREWEGLTDEDLDIRALWDVLAGMKNADGSIVVQFAKAIEAKLKEKNT